MSPHAVDPNNYDVVIIGAGISGINLAYRLQTQLPDYSYTILEARGGIGGTWDFFKYPGIRSDSDLHTFGFSWQPWIENKTIADGASIVNYIKQTAASHGITEHVQFHHKLVAADWSSDQQAWRLSVTADEKDKTFHARFLMLASGYYDYEEAMPSVIPGIENFKGTVVHPQFWPKDLDYADKRIVIVGSGATAVTLLPRLAETAAHVTMLQRSPSYLLNQPQDDASERLARRLLPTYLLHKFLRFKYLLLPWLFFNFCRTFPTAARNLLRTATTAQLPSTIAHDPHFEPTYNPWEQRMCVCPDGDFFKSLHAGRADVATGLISTLTPSSILLQTGQSLPADIIITATGLKIQMCGGARLTVDNRPIRIADKFVWKGIMLQDVPNCGLFVGYTNASWTLGADASAQHLCRILKRMRDQGNGAVVPRLEHPEALKTLPLLNLNSTYLKRAEGRCPRRGTRRRGGRGRIISRI